MTYKLFSECGSQESMDLNALIAIAEARILALPESEKATFAIYDEEGAFTTSRSNRRIEGVFYKQEWGGRKNDLALLVGEETFDATDAVLNLCYQDFQALQDGDETSDEIGRAHVDWSGPCEVQIVDSVCEYFGVQSLKSITEDAFNDIKAYAHPNEIVRESLTVTLKIEVDRASNARMEDFVNNMVVNVRSMTPGVVVRNKVMIEAQQELDGLSSPRGMRP